MVFDLEFLEQLIRQKVLFLTEAASVIRHGRGERLRELIELCCARVIRSLDEKLADMSRLGEDASEDETRNFSRELERLLTDLTSYYNILSTYRHDAGRDDLPVGLLNLIDQVIVDLLPEGADPLIHSDHEENYGTSNLRQGLPIDMDPPYPIAIHIPALTPASALLSPLLVHEVAHSAGQDQAMEGLLNEWDANGTWDQINALFDQHAANSRADSSGWMRNLISWCEELFCDGIATALTGPSYVYSIAHFLALPNGRPGSSHPPDRLRVAFCLKVLEQHGWLPEMLRWHPKILEWMIALSADAVSPRSSKDRFLTAAIDLVTSDLVRVATSRVPEAFRPNDHDENLTEALLMLAEGIPPVSLSTPTLSVWQIVLCGWISGVTSGGNIPRAINSAAVDVSLNALLIKTMEMVKIVELWEQS